jgi:trigger factor
MSVEIKKLENSVVEIKLNLEGEEVSKVRSQVIKEIQGRAEIPGFRKGKAPVSTITAKFAGLIKEEVTDKLLKTNYEKLVIENGLKPVDYLQTKEVILEDNKFEGTFTVEVYPEVTLGDYKELEVEKETFEVTDEMVEEEINAIVERGAQLVDAEEGYAAQIGDTVTIDFEGFVEGEAFEGGKGDGYPLSLGSKSFIDNFEDQLVGYTAGQEGEINVNFPEEYFKKELAGKPATFKVKINSIKKVEKPELNDELAKENDFESVEDMRAKKKEEIVNRETTRVDNAYRNALVDQALANAKLDAPISMIQRETRARISDFENQLKMQGATLEMYLKMAGLTMDNLYAQIRPMAETKVKREIVLAAIAKAEDVNVSDEEMDAKLDEVSKMYNMEVSKLQEELTSAGNLDNFMESLKEEVIMRKTVDLLVENAK